MELKTWADGEKNRPVHLEGPFPYLTGSDADGNGFSIFPKSEEDLFRLVDALRAARSGGPDPRRIEAAAILNHPMDRTN